MKTENKKNVTFFALLAIIIFSSSLQSCHTLPPAVEKPPSQMMPMATTGPLAEVSDQVQKRIGLQNDGLLLIFENEDALEYRLALIDSAQHSLDIQMFLWSKDLTGRLLLERILQAADRGVRVRLLLDDLSLENGYSDKQLLTISTHPRVAVRLYNAFHVRGGILLHALEINTNPTQNNQRMHNKTIIADSTLAILSGRNASDHSFDYSRHYNNIDLGVLVSGPITTQIAHGFDRYWKSNPSYDVSAFHSKIKPLSLDEFRKKSNTWVRKKNTQLSHQTTDNKRDWKKCLSLIPRKMHAAKVQYVEDPPQIPKQSHPVYSDILTMASKSHKDLILATPYFVPDQKLLNLLYSVRRRGVRVRLLTPSIAANNHAIIHNQYQKYRNSLLELGVEIYEFKHHSTNSVSKYSRCNLSNSNHHRLHLHTKAVVVDSQFSYIGSFNFDIRSMFLNTEQGLLIDSPPLANELKCYLEDLMQPENAWRLHLDAREKIEWTSGNLTQRQEPTLNAFQFILEGVLRPFHLKNKVFPDHQLYQNQSPKCPLQ